MKRAVFAVLLTLYLYIPGISQVSVDPEAAIDSFIYHLDFFEDNYPLELTLKFDIKQFQRKKSDEEYQPAELTYRFNDTLELASQIRVRSRGNFRRDYCKMPPVMINIKESGIKNKYLGDENKIKLVNPCKNTEAHNDYVLKEYLAYKIYNILTPSSFRVRLVRIRYIDTGRKNKETTNWGFIIEPEDVMGKRLGGFAFKRDHLGLSSMDEYHADLMSIFQYMVGNSDYSITGRHNLKIIIITENMNQKVIPIPYDFDYSGFVNALYAVPGENLGIKSVTERYFLGPCREEEQYNKIIDDLLENKEAIYSVVHSCEALSEKGSRSALSYLEEFFKLAESDRLIRYLRMTCR